MQKFQPATRAPFCRRRDEAATCRTKADAPEIDGNLFIDEGFENLSVGQIVTVEVEEAGEYDLWGRVV